MAVVMDTPIGIRQILNFHYKLAENIVAVEVTIIFIYGKRKIMTLDNRVLGEAFACTLIFINQIYTIVIISLISARAVSATAFASICKGIYK
jgi:hypothetical protein